MRPIVLLRRLGERRMHHAHEVAIAAIGKHESIYLEGWASFFAFLSATACSATVLLYSCASDAEQIISRISNHSGCNRRRNLFKGLHGFVYILGSSIVIVNSMMSWFTRCHVSVTFNSSLCGRPTLSIHVLSSSPTVSATNV